MRTRITTRLLSGRDLMIVTLLMLSLMNINSSEASNADLAYAEKTTSILVTTTIDTRMNSLTKTCLMATQLKDPEIRADYDAIIADSEGTGINRNVHIDPVSMECISCHDGTIAKVTNHRISEGNTNRVKSIETIKGAHPIGMDYDKFRWDKTYVPAENLAADIILIDGRVGCASCHNLLGRNDKYLAVDNSKSSLCFSCHNI